MTGQVLAAALIAAVIVPLFSWLIRRDCRRARYRRDPWWGWTELGFTTDDRVPPGGIFMVAPLKYEPMQIRVGYDESLKSNLATLAVETRIGLTVLRLDDPAWRKVDLTP